MILLVLILVVMGSTSVTPLIIPPGRTVLPLRFIAENLGSNVEWEPVTREVTVIYPAN